MKAPKQKILDPIDDTKHALDSEEAGEVRADNYDDTQLPTEMQTAITDRIDDDSGSDDLNQAEISAEEEVESLETLAAEEIGENPDIIYPGDETNE